MIHIFKKLKHISLYGSFALMIVSLFCIILLGLPLGIAFTGGSEVEISFSTPQSKETIERAFSSVGESVEAVSRSPLVYTLLIQSDTRETLQEDVRNTLLTLDSDAQILRFDIVGAKISGETGVKTLVALFFGFCAVAFFIALAFSSAADVLASWKYGAVALITLFHDVLVSLGIFVLIAHIYTISVDVFFVTAILAIIGYSINDTIVIFDRIRDVIAKQTLSFEEAVWSGTAFSVRRSIYTSITTLVPLAVIFYTIPFVQWFAFALFIGIVVGVYSSLFFAPTLLVWWHTHSPKKDMKRVEDENETEKAEKELMKRLQENTI